MTTPNEMAILAKVAMSVMNYWYQSTANCPIINFWCRFYDFIGFDTRQFAFTQNLRPIFIFRDKNKYVPVTCGKSCKIKKVAPYSEVTPIRRNRLSKNVQMWFLLLFQRCFRVIPYQIKWFHISCRKNIQTFGIF